MLLRGLSRTYEALTNIAGPIVGMAFIERFGYDWFWASLLMMNLTGLGFYFVLRRSMDQKSVA